MNKQSDFLQKIAERALNDISNQEEGKTRFNWLTKQVFRQSKGMHFIQLPSIEQHKISKKENDKNLPVLVKQKNKLLKERMKQVLIVAGKKKSLPHYNINQKLDQQMGFGSRQNYSKSVLQSSSGKKIEIHQRYYTQHSAFQIHNEGQNSLKVNKFRSCKGLNKNWSSHVTKMLINLNKNKEDHNTEIEQIKQLIQDKRNKCRKLSKQGYLIIKSDSVDLKNRQNLSMCAKKAQRYKAQHEDTKHFSLLKDAMLSKKVFLKQQFKSGKFLDNAYQILNLNQYNKQN